MKAARILATLAVLLCATRLDAQQYFGMNQVQYKHFNWQVIETEHWLVHYYPEEKEGAMATVAAHPVLQVLDVAIAGPGGTTAA